MTDPRKPTFVLTLEAQHDQSDPDGYRRLRMILKRLLRAFGFKCLKVEGTNDGANSS